MSGIGGFVNISQNARRLVFCGTMTSGGLETNVVDGKLVIVNEGRTSKFLNHVDHVSYSGEVAREAGHDVLMVTERAVFRFTKEGLELIEVAPGIDVSSQILAVMDFTPIMNDVHPMRSELFQVP